MQPRALLRSPGGAYHSRPGRPLAAVPRHRGEGVHLATWRSSRHRAGAEDWPTGPDRGV